MNALSISNPCPVSWDGMTPNESGRFCDQCQLTVVDFTAMTESEIKNYFQCNYGKKTCGRFKTSQLESSISGITKFWSSLSNRIEVHFRQPSLKTYLLSILAMLAFITGCSRRPVYHRMGDIEVMGDTVQVEKKDTLKYRSGRENPVKIIHKLRTC